MAITMTVVGQNKAVTSAATIATDAISLTSGNEYILVAFANDASGTPDDPTCTGWTAIPSAFTYTQQGSQPSIRAFRKSGDASNTTYTITYASTQTERLWLAIEIVGSNTGASLVTQVSTGATTGNTTGEYTASGVGDTTAGCGTLNALANSSNAVISFVACTINGTISANAGWTGLGTLSTLTGTVLQCLAEWKVNDILPDFTKPNFTYDVAFGMEIAAAAASGAAPASNYLRQKRG